MITIKGKTVNLCIICAYMPYRGKGHLSVEYEHYLDMLWAIISKYSSKYIIIVCGDLNANPVNPKDSRDKALAGFCGDHGLVTTKYYYSGSSFAQKGGQGSQKLTTSRGVSWGGGFGDPGSPGSPKGRQKERKKERERERKRGGRKEEKRRKKEKKGKRKKKGKKEGARKKKESYINMTRGAPCSFKSKQGLQGRKRQWRQLDGEKDERGAMQCQVQAGAPGKKMSGAPN